MPHDENTANVTGHLTITQNVENGPVKIVGHVHGLTPGLHGFHVHQKGTLEQGCTSTGAHFNPTEVSFECQAAMYSNSCFRASDNFDSRFK